MKNEKKGITMRLEIILFIALLLMLYKYFRLKQTYESGIVNKSVRIDLSEQYDRDLIENLKPIKNKGEFFKIAARVYFQENKEFNGNDDYA